MHPGTRRERRRWPRPEIAQPAHRLACPLLRGQRRLTRGRAPV